MPRIRSARRTIDENGRRVWVSDIRPMRFDYPHTAVILSDAWDHHWSRAAEERLTEMAPRLNDFLTAMRERGAFIIHAPSDTLSFYRDSAAYRRMEVYSAVAPTVVCDIQDIPMPVEADDGGSDSLEPPERVNEAVWTRQHPLIEIDETRDGICDDGARIYACLREKGIQTVFITGVHTNMCVLNRSFGIKNLLRWGLSPVLVRDLTDLMYNPDCPPYVSHEQALELVIHYIEGFYCPSVLSTDLMKEDNC